jgi:3D (Asp-Asp-Asp) domain-containing protein
MSKYRQFNRKAQLVIGSLLVLLIIYGGLIGFSKDLIGLWFLADKEALAQSQVGFDIGNSANESNRVLLTIQENTLLPIRSALLNEERITKRIKVIVTAYSSSYWETDDTPYITASGSFVREGIAANNLLPFGTKFKMPEIFGEKVFVVEDRLNSRKGDYHVDIWFPSREEALKFGTKRTYIEVLQES